MVRFSLRCADEQGLPPLPDRGGPLPDRGGSYGGCNLAAVSCWQPGAALVTLDFAAGSCSN